MLSTAGRADQYQLTYVYDKLLTIVVLLARGLLASPYNACLSTA